MQFPNFSSLTHDFISGSIGAALGVVFTAFAFTGKKIIQWIQHVSNIRRLKKTEFLFDDNLNIYTIENAVPEYKELEVVSSGKKFYIDIPDEYRDRLARFKFHSNYSLDATDSFHGLSITTGIYDLERLIAEHSKLVAEDFINETNGCKFNEMKYGVYDISIGSRVGQNEDPIARIITFETDFFTYRVMYSIYQELKRRNHEMCRITSLKELRKYNCFSCSIGTQTLVSIDSEKFGKEQLILTRRSDSTINYHNMYHISANEGMCYMDYNPSSGRFSVDNCLFRGIEEELGIPVDYHIKHGTEYSYWDLFISRDTFDFCISCHVKIKDIYYDQVKAMIGKDRKFEISKIDSVEANKKEIGAYIECHNFIPQGLYVLNSYSIRRYGSAIRVPVKKIL